MPAASGRPAAAQAAVPPSRATGLLSGRCAAKSAAASLARRPSALVKTSLAWLPRTSETWSSRARIAQAAPGTCPARVGETVAEVDDERPCGVGVQGLRGDGLDRGRRQLRHRRAARTGLQVPAFQALGQALGQTLGQTLGQNRDAGEAHLVQPAGGHGRAHRAVVESGRSGPPAPPPSGRSPGPAGRRAPRARRAGGRPRTPRDRARRASRACDPPPRPASAVGPRGRST